ncbi:MAG: hypothetical protein Q4G24_08350 [Paracoccus sp. (in: a-proteobacteria)]|uniref:hypothetical protein n=1 Tax=Paracoccus sp. TaxID=267 RepID=UPI0026E06964|nr:hypothetical protein [Paracoccus sp. (in: a-proteobacteria)]MDO5621464.1 hypothetical protein [Paracoccus sp. (in: a-proteobacteria)]
MAELTEREWRAILEPGEQIIWQGAPEGARLPKGEARFAWMFGGLFAAVGGLFFLIGVATTASEPMLRIIFTGLGGICLSIGLAAMILPRILFQRRIARTRYALTNRRALILEQKIISFRITPDMEIDFQPGNPPAIWFGTEETSLVINNRPVIRDIGFAAVPNAPELVELIRDMQAKMTGQAPHAG